MADRGNSDSADLQLILERIDPANNIARYHILSVEATLFARNTFVRRWGRIGSTGRQRLEFFDSGIPPGYISAGDVAGEKAQARIHVEIVEAD